MARVLEKVAMYRFGPWYRPRIDESFLSVKTKHGGDFGGAKFEYIVY